MFCSKCGFEFSDDTNFCPKCGTPINGTSASFNVNNQKNLRDEALQTIEQLQDYFSEKHPQYDEIDKLDRKVLKAKKLTFLKLLIVIIVFFLLFAQSFLIFKDNWLLACVPPAIAIVILIILNKLRIKKMEERQTQVLYEIIDHYNELSYCPIGVEYTDPQSLESIRSIVYAGRAETIKEALNIMIDDIHKSNMETAAFVAAQSAYSAAKSSRVAAVTGTINLFKK